MSRHLGLLLAVGAFACSCSTASSSRSTDASRPDEISAGWVTPSGGRSPDSAARGSDAPARGAIPRRTRLVEAGEFATGLGMAYHSEPARRRVVIEGVGDRAILYPGTTVAVVNGRPVEHMEKIRASGGAVLLDERDAKRMSRLLATTEMSQGKTVAHTVGHSGALEPVHQAGPARSPAARADPKWLVRHKAKWLYIVVHHSATDQGNAASFDRNHREKRGWDGLGYHFVIGNGRGSGDGEVEVGYRWRQQLTGAHAGKAANGSNVMNERGIGICLVGDFSKARPTAAQRASLARLIDFLRGYCGIPAERVIAHRDVRETDCPGENFPYAEFFEDRRVVPTAYRRK